MRYTTLAVLLAALVAPLPFSAATDVPCASHPQAGTVCPDLIVNPFDNHEELSTETFYEDDCAVVEGLVAPGVRTLLRFPLGTANLGPGPVVVGHPADHPELFTHSTCHGHMHFDGFAAYRLWRPDTYVTWATLRTTHPDATSDALIAAHPEIADGLVSGRKQGFCIIDSAPIIGVPTPPVYATCAHQGLSAFWQDRYEAYLDGQWIDVTGLPAGDYVLELEVDPARRIAETDDTNNALARHVYVG